VEGFIALAVFATQLGDLEKCVLRHTLRRSRQTVTTNLARLYKKRDPWRQRIPSRKSTRRSRQSPHEFLEARIRSAKPAVVTGRVPAPYT